MCPVGGGLERPGSVGMNSPLCQDSLHVPLAEFACFWRVDEALLIGDGVGNVLFEVGTAGRGLIGWRAPREGRRLLQVGEVSASPLSDAATAHRVVLIAVAGGAIAPERRKQRRRFPAPLGISTPLSFLAAFLDRIPPNQRFPRKTPTSDRDPLLLLRIGFRSYL